MLQTRQHYILYATDIKNLVFKKASGKCLKTSQQEKLYLQIAYILGV